MKKKVISILLIITVSALLFIPFSQQKIISVKKPFFDTYQHLARADNWKKWRRDLRAVPPLDSAKILSEQQSNGFKINYNDINLMVKVVDGYTFAVDDNGSDYSYTIIPNKMPDSTSIVVTKPTNVLGYLLNLTSKKSFSATHIEDFEDFMSNPDLYYGYKIIKRKVTDTTIIVLKNVVPAKIQFTEAAKILNTLQSYVKQKGANITQPLMAQFLTKTNDSVQIKIGLPVNKKITTKSPLAFMEMPAGGSMYTADFKGKFIDRLKAYAAVRQYFADRGLAMPILPFETYLDNKLPEKNSDVVNIRINFPTF